jgi:hypothetical protein
VILTQVLPDPHEALALKQAVSPSSHMHIQYERFQQFCVQQSKLATFFASIAARAAFILWTE